MALAVYQILNILLNLLWWIIIAQFILSLLIAFNVINTHNDFVRQLLYALDKITEPLFRPIRRVMPDLGMLDFSPAIVLILITILQQAVLPAIFRPLIVG
ncbi:MAG: YggT family protein [Sphingobium sp.]|nr:YggT family protein [Sphingobium sp.]